MLKFDVEEARAIVQEEHPDYVVVEKHWRYQEKGVNFFWVIVKNVKTGKHYKTFYRFGFKPSLGSFIHPYEREEPEFMEVEWQRVVVEEWVVVGED